jgi:hypothetical protein
LFHRIKPINTNNQKHRLILFIFFKVKKLWFDWLYRQDLSKCFKTITWLRGFLCQLTHEWWLESNWCVINWELPTLSGTLHRSFYQHHILNSLLYWRRVIQWNMQLTASVTN